MDNKILRNWDLELDIRELQGNIWNVGNKYILKSFDKLDNVNKNVKLTKLLTSSHINIPYIKETVDNREFIMDNLKYYILFEKIDGINIVDLFNKNYLHIGKESAKCIASLHKGLKKIEKDIDINDNNILFEMKSWIYYEFERYGWSIISYEEYLKLLNKLELLSINLPTQLVHGDLHLGNLLYKDSRFTGYIDFDLSEKNLRVFDISYFLVSIISENSDIMLDNKKWRDFYNTFLDQCSIENELTNEEIEAVPIVMMAIELLFVAYFLRAENIHLAEKTMEIYRFLENFNKKL